MDNLALVIVSGLIGAGIALAVWFVISVFRLIGHVNELLDNKVHVEREFENVWREIATVSEEIPRDVA